MYFIQTMLHEVLLNDLMLKMNETQKKRYQHLTNPGVIISLLVAIFWIWITRWTLNYRVNIIEDRKAEIDVVKTQYYDIQTKLAEIQTNLSWIMANMK